MYKQDIYTIKENTNIARDVYKMRLEGDTQYITAPGQFINISLEGKYLRRPISVCDKNEGEITIIYKVLGSGTAQMSKMAVGEKLDILTGLGNGFDPDANTKKPLLIGGGVGIPPLFMLAKELIKRGKKPSVVIGCKSSVDVFYVDEFKAIGCDVFVATEDGTMGVKGFVTDAIKENNVEFDYTYACGPIPMLKAIYNASDVSGQYSFEERMGCGFGACMGCTCKTKYGNKRICKDGPVLVKEEIIW